MLYEPGNKIGGLAHVLLPTGSEGSAKYPDGAISELVRRFASFGIDKDRISAKIVGGATMFSGFGKESIGKRNVLETREALKKAGIPLIAEDVFGSWGRTVFFDLSSGDVLVRSYRHGEKVL
jgi:chemotaxis protein CheD